MLFFFKCSKIEAMFRKQTGGQRIEDKKFLDYCFCHADRFYYRNSYRQLLQRNQCTELAELWAGIRAYQPLGAGSWGNCADTWADH